MIRYGINITSPQKLQSLFFTVHQAAGDDCNRCSQLANICGGEKKLNMINDKITNLKSLISLKSDGWSLKIVTSWRIMTGFLKHQANNATWMQQWTNGFQKVCLLKMVTSCNFIFWIDMECNKLVYTAKAQAVWSFVMYLEVVICLLILLSYQKIHLTYITNTYFIIWLYDIRIYYIYIW